MEVTELKNVLIDYYLVATDTQVNELCMRRGGRVGCGGLRWANYKKCVICGAG